MFARSTPSAPFAMPCCATAPRRRRRWKGSTTSSPASINPEIPSHLRPGGAADRYETAVARCYQRLRDAEGHLASAKQWRKTLDQAVEAFRTEQYRFKDVLQENLPAALTMLEKKLATLAGYISVPLPSEPDRPIAAVPWPVPPAEEAPAVEDG